MGKKIDLTGQKFNKLTVVREGEPRRTYNKKYGRYFIRIRWWCECDCGNPELVLVDSSSLKNGNTKSCGCLHTETSSKNGKSTKKYNKYDLSGEYGIGYASNTMREFYFDLEDYDKIKNYCWCEHNLTNGYDALETVDTETKKTIRFHYLLNMKNSDHINRNPFDNRKENLRECTKRGNAINHTIRKDNTSGVTGVYWNKNTNKWYAGVSENGIMDLTSGFTNKKDAIKARLELEKEHYGEFSPNAISDIDEITTNN